MEKKILVVLTGRATTVITTEGRTTLQPDGYLEAAGESTPAATPLDLDGGFSVPVSVGARKFTSLVVKSGEMPPLDADVLVNFFVAPLLIAAGHTGAIYTPGNPVREDGKIVGVEGLVRWQ